MSRDVRPLPNEAAALAQYHAINRARGLPRKGVHVGRGPHVEMPETPTDEDHAGYTLTCVTLVDGPGPTVGVDITELTEADRAAMHGRQEDTADHGRVTIDVRTAVRNRRADEVDRSPRVPK